jgi:hypothetical protein
MIYHQSVHLGFKPLEIHEQRHFFYKLNLCCHSLYVTPFQMRRWVCLLWICLAFRQHVIENSSFCIMYKSSVSTGFGKQNMPIVCILCYNGSLVTWRVVSLTAAKFKPLIFSTSGFDLSYIANMFILMILYDFCLLPALFCYMVIYVWKVESGVQIMKWCAPWKIFSGADNLVL